jgi:hypothetical protein
VKAAAGDSCWLGMLAAGSEGGGCPRRWRPRPRRWLRRATRSPASCCPQRPWRCAPRVTLDGWTGAGNCCCRDHGCLLRAACQLAAPGDHHHRCACPAPCPPAAGGAPADPAGHCIRGRARDRGQQGGQAPKGRHRCTCSSSPCPATTAAARASSEGQTLASPSKPCRRLQLSLACPLPRSRRAWWCTYRPATPAARWSTRCCTTAGWARWRCPAARRRLWG